MSFSPSPLTEGGGEGVKLLKLLMYKGTYFKYVLAIFFLQLQFGLKRNRQQMEPLGARSNIVH